MVLNDSKLDSSQRKVIFGVIFESLFLDPEKSFLSHRKCHFWVRDLWPNGVSQFSNWKRNDLEKSGKQWSSVLSRKLPTVNGPAASDLIGFELRASLRTIIKAMWQLPPFQGPLNGGVSNGGGFPDLDLSFLFCPFLSVFGTFLGLFCPFLPFFVLFCPFWDFPVFSGIFPICSRMDRGFPICPFPLSLGLLGAPTRNSPERVRDTIWKKASYF